MAADELPDCFHETFQLSIQPKAGTAYEMDGITEDISGFDFGEKGIDGVALANGGRIAKWTPQADESITIKAWPTDVLMGTEGFWQYFHPLASADATGTAEVANTRKRVKVQAIIRWSTNPPATAGAAGTANAREYLIVIKNAYVTSVKPGLEDKNMSAEITLKWPPFDTSGTANMTHYSTDGSATLAEVTSYT